MYIKMINGIVTVFGLCFIQVSPQMNFQQARLFSTVKSIDELFEKVWIISPSGNGLEKPSDVFPDLQKYGDKVYIGMDTPEIATPSVCKPQMTTVEIPRRPYENIKVYTWPPATRVHRCGGCCTNNMLKCVPTATAIRQFMVLQVRTWGSDTPHLMMEWEGYRIVDVEEHNACEIMCGITEKDCNSHQIFYKSECQCVCEDSQLICPPGTTINLANCTCQQLQPVDTLLTFMTPDIQIQDDDAIQLTGGEYFEDDWLVHETREPTPAKSIIQARVEPSQCSSNFYCPPNFTRVVWEGGCFCKPAFTFPGRDQKKMWK